MQVGGNDLRHESECISGIKLLNGQHGPIPEACKDVEYAANNLFETVANLATELDYLYQNLRALAPEATIVAVGYPHIIDANSPNCSLDAFPGVTPALKQAFNALVDAGNAQIKQTAGNLGITAITDEIATRFAGHEVCSADEWIVSLEQLRSLEPHEITRGGHPNDVGHQMIADVVLTYLPTVTANNGTVIPEGGGEVGEPGTEGGEIGEPGTEGGEVGEPGTEGGEIGEPGTEGGEVGEPGTEGGEEGECQTTSKIEGQQIGRGSL